MRAFTGRGPLAFPNARHAHRPMSENAIGYLLNRAGYHRRHVPHGWRATFSTLMNERGLGSDFTFADGQARWVQGSRKEDLSPLLPGQTSKAACPLPAAESRGRRDTAVAAQKAVAHGALA